MDHSAGASSEHLEARSELLLVTSLELAAAKGTVGKLSISAFRWRRQREPSEPSLAISTAMDHPRKVARRRKVPELAIVRGMRFGLGGADLNPPGIGLGQGPLPVA